MGKLEGMNGVRDILLRLTPAGHVPKGRVLLLGWGYLSSPCVHLSENAPSWHFKLQWTLSSEQMTGSVWGLTLPQVVAETKAYRAQG